MRKQRLLCSTIIDEYEKNIMVIKPAVLQDFQDDSIYEFRLPDLIAKDGTILKAHRIKYITKPTPMYATIKDVRNKLGDVDISDERILYHLKEASRFAEIVVSRAFEKNNLKFTNEDLQELRKQGPKEWEQWALWNFVVLKATYACLSNLYIYMATKPDKVKEMLSDLSTEVNFNLAAIKKLLDDLKKDYEKEIDKILTVADPVCAVRGRLAIPISPNLGAPYHQLNGMSGYGRSYNGFNNYSYRGGRY